MPDDGVISYDSTLVTLLRLNRSQSSLRQLLLSAFQDHTPEKQSVNGIDKVYVLSVVDISTCNIFAFGSYRQFEINLMAFFLFFDASRFFCTMAMSIDISLISSCSRSCGSPFRIEGYMESPKTKRDMGIPCPKNIGFMVEHQSINFQNKKKSIIGKEKKSDKRS